ncbi:MAG: hypothetical protein EA422_12420 [Gemmatimonadales bacterium]|nr:MAG: hypothetical protein EA422_12420 [Gemmatimonadales bacterium]
MEGRTAGHLLLALAVTLAAAAVLLTAPAAAGAQTPGPRVQIQVPADEVTQELRLRDGSILFGRVLAEGDPFRFQLVSGQVLEIAVADVRSLRETRGRAVEGVFWAEDPNRTRLFFGPTGRMLEAGEGYLQVFQILFPVVAFGVADRFTLAGGTLLLFTSDLSGQPFWFAPKVGIARTEVADFAAGILAFFTTDSTESVGILYGAASFGDPDGSLHLGIGYGYERGNLASRPAVLVGGEYRVGRNVKLLSENYLFPREGGLVSGGVRLFGDRLSADLGLATPLGTGFDFFAFPVVNFSWSW